MSLSNFQQKIIQDFCFSEPRTIQQIAERLELVGHKSFMAIYNYLQTQGSKLKFLLEKLDGIWYIRTNPLFFSPLSLDLICDKQNAPRTDKTESGSSVETSFERKTVIGKHHERLTDIKRACPEKLEAMLKLNRISRFGFYNKESKEFEFTNSVKQEIDTLFKAYCSRIRNEKIILTRAPSGSPVFAQDLVIAYQTRFTSPARQKENMEGFRAAYGIASRRHMKGVFLTLTSQPSASNTLLQVNKNTQKAWGKFSKFLGRCLPSRAEWIKVAEFQKNGMLHFHVLILGVNWLLHKSVIQYAWMKYGGGSILDIHTIKNDPVYGWQWARSCPLEAAGKKVGDYLGAYLEKSMSSLHGSMYWVTGIRNWTCSGNLLPKTPKDKPLKSSKKGYFLKGVMSALTGFRASHRSDSMRLFTGSLSKQENKQTQTPTKDKINKQVQSLTFSQASTLAYLQSSRNTQN